MSLTFSDWVWKASTHPVKVSTDARRYLYPDSVDIWMRSNYQSSSRYVPQCSVDLSNERGIGWVCGLLWAHKSQACITYFTVLLNSFTEKTFCIKSHSISLSEWRVSCKLLVSFHCWASDIRILPSFLISACDSLLIAPFLSMLLFLWGNSGEG